MIRTIVVDDEWYSLSEICDMARRTGFMSVEGCFQNGADVLREAERLRPQAAFIDIEMPEMSGLTLAEKLLELVPDIKIVFITGWNQYAVAAFELNALDYIMKPVNRKRFEKMAKRLQHGLSVQKTVQPIKLAVRCFGAFETLQNGTPVVWKRTKAKELFAFLILNANTLINKDVILENLWPHYERSKSLPILQTSICKIRNVFSECRDSVNLTYADNKYGLFLSSVECDYFFVRDALVGFKEKDSRTYPPLLKACGIFQKGLLPYNGYQWAENYASELRNGLVPALRSMAALSPVRVPEAEKLLQKLTG